MQTEGDWLCLAQHGKTHYYPTGSNLSLCKKAKVNQPTVMHRDRQKCWLCLSSLKSLKLYGKKPGSLESFRESGY